MKLSTLLRQEDFNQYCLGTILLRIESVPTLEEEEEEEERILTGTLP